MSSREKNAVRETWGSRLGFILAAAGWSIGLGNIWRFPYITGKYGGGAFVLLYLISLIVVAMPLFIVEFSLGRASKSSITTGFRKLSPRGPWFIGGWIGILGNILIFSYYTMIIGWVIAYMFKTIRAQYFELTANQISEMFDNFTTSSGEVFLWQIFVYVILGVIVSRGLVRGIEAFSKIAMPILFLMLIGLGIYSLTLPGALKGVEFYLKPDFTKITGEAILVAIGQAFLSLGVGFGSSWVYGSYLDRTANIPGDVIRVALLDTLGALLAGLIIFPAAFTFGVNSDVGQRLIFVTLPNVFGKMPGGMVFGICFFFLVTVAALTSAIAHTECISSWLMDELKWDRSRSRVKAIWIIIIGCFVLGIPSVLSLSSWSSIKLFGLNIFSFVDHVSANIFLVMAGLIMALYAGWSMGIKRFMEITNEGAKGILVKPFWGVLIRYIIPIIIVALFLGKIFNS